MPESTHRPVFVLGNGESRLQFNIDALRTEGRIYGCNALYRDFDPDVLVAIDEHMVDEIVASGYLEKHTCYFAKNNSGQVIPPECLVGEYGKTQYCGPTATRLAIRLDNPRSIYLIGFDIIDRKWSNVYVGTRGYADNRELARRTVAAGQNVVHNPPTLKQLRDIFDEYPQVTFYKVMENYGFQYTVWHGLPNLVYLTPNQFRQRFPQC